MAEFKDDITKALEKALGGKAKKEEIGSLLEEPSNPEMGDYAFPCFKLAGRLNKAPQQIAEQLASEIKLPTTVARLKAAGPYLNFFVKKEELAGKAISEILKKKDSYGKSKTGNGKKVMVEYSAPNTNKPLHVGHVRNNCIGMAVSNLLEATGHKVIKANLVNDRGVHICKSMLAYKKWGKGKKPSKNRKSDHFVGDFYVQFNKQLKEDPSLEQEALLMLRKWENQDKEVIALWKKMNKWAIDGFKQTYKDFGVKFDIWLKESEFYNKAKPILEDGTEKGVFFEDDEGKLVAKLEHHDLPNKVVLRSDGSSIYITNDLALTKHKFEKFKLDQSIWVVASEQNLYFQQLFKIFELLGFKWFSGCRHLSYGMVFLPEGKMKSREGTVVDADDLLKKMADLSAKEITKRYPTLSAKEKEKRAKAIALAAIKFYMLRVDESRDLQFNPKESLSFEGETGPYLQYTYARAKSILRKSKKKSGKIDFSLLESETEKKVAKLLYAFPESVEKAGLSLRPHIVSQHLVELASAFNSFYHSSRVLNAENERLVKARLALVEATAQVLKNGLGLLSIEAIEKM